MYAMLMSCIVRVSGVVRLCGEPLRRLRPGAFALGLIQRLFFPGLLCGYAVRVRVTVCLHTRLLCVLTTTRNLSYIHTYTTPHHIPLPPPLHNKLANTTHSHNVTKEYCNPNFTPQLRYFFLPGPNLPSYYVRLQRFLPPSCISSYLNLAPAAKA